jgi:hypothetical protein
MAGLIPFLMQTMAYRRALEEREMAKREREAKSDDLPFSLPDALSDPTAKALQYRPYDPSAAARQVFPDIFKQGQP